MAAEARTLQLPTGVVTRSDVGRLSREAEAVDSFLSQAAIRQPGTPVQLPKTSKLLDELVATNSLNMLQPADRKLVRDFLFVVRNKAPVLHMSFNSDPSPVFQQKLVAWIRQQMHPFVLLQFGLNPGIGAGCVVRTTNKYFDFSLRNKFTEQRPVLIARLKGSPEAVKEAPAVVEPLQGATA